MHQTILKYRLYYIPFILLIIELFFVRLRLVFSYSLDLIGLEYYFTHIVQQILTNQAIYPDPETLPYANCLYTPVYFYCCSAATYFFKLNIQDDIFKLMVIGRMICYLLVLGQLFYLIRLSKRFTSSVFLHIIIVTLYVLLITEHMYAVRPDAMKIFFFIVFLFHFTKYNFYSNKLIDAIICVAAATFAVYSKQDIAIYISVCFIVAFIIIRSKKIFYLFLSFIFCCLISLVICVLIFGKDIFQNIILFNIQSVSNLMSSYNMIFFAISISRTFPFLFISVINFNKLRKSGSEHTAEKFIVITSILLYFAAHISMSRAGSNLNYTYELLILLVLNIPIFVKLHTEIILLHKKKLTTLLVFFIILLFLSNSSIGNYTFSNSKEARLKKDYYIYQSESKAIAGIIKDDYAFFPNTKYSVFYINKHIVLGHDMHLDRFVNLYTKLNSFQNLNFKTNLPYINSDKYDGNFKDGTIAYVIIENELKSKNHTAYYYPDYKPYKRVGNMLIYKFQKSL